MALAAGTFYSTISDSTQLLLCTNAAGFEFQQLPSGNVQKYSASPEAQLTALTTAGLSALGTVPSDGPVPSALLDGARVQIMESYGSDGTLANSKVCVVRPAATVGDTSGSVGAPKDVPAEYLVIPTPCLTDTNPPNIFPPFVYNAKPAALPAAGNVPVVVQGTGFKNASAVHFGATAADPATIKVISDTELHVTAPAHAAATVAVTVTTPGGTSPATASSNVTYA